MVTTQTQTNSLVAHDFKIPITSEEDLKEYVRLAFGVKIPDKQVCENHSTPWRAFCDAYFARNRVVVWKASRGLGGKSFLVAVLGTVEATTLKADVSLLGGSGEQSKRIIGHMQDLWEYESAPDLLESGISREVRLAWSNKIEALMASQASVRGPHPQRLRIDEVDETDISIIDAALGQPMSKNGIPANTVFSSTHQYANGAMTEVLKRAATKGWIVHEWCWKETQEPHGWLTNEEIEGKRIDVTDEMWRVEYDLQEPSFGARAIKEEAVERMFKKELGIFNGDPNEYIEIEPPQPDGVYAHGADWAKTTDWTIIPTFRVDVDPVRCVAWERTGRLAWPTMVGKLEERIRRYRNTSGTNSQAKHDATGIGNVIDDYLAEPSDPFVFVGKDRAQLLTRYIAACEHDEIEYPMIRYAYGEHKYASVEDVFSGKNHPVEGDKKKSHLPDTIAAGALSWSVHSRAGVVPEKKRKSHPLRGVKGM